MDKIDYEKMKFFLLANIGSNDVWENNNRIDKDKIRSRGKEILDNLSSYKEKISFPIIQPYLNVFSDKIEKIYLFVTDQPEERYSNQDTIYFGEIMKKIIEEKFQIAVEVKRYCGNPMNFEQIATFYREILEKIGNERVIISISGGIPLMNYALLISSLFIFNSPLIYRIDEKSGQIKELDYRSIKKIFVKSSLMEFVQTYNYSGALKVLEENSLFLEPKKFETLQLLLKYLIERLHFNFEKAEALKEKILSVNPKINEELLSIHNFTEKGLLYELYSNMAIKWFNGEIVDFISRFFRFTEANLQFLFNENIGKINWSENKEKIKEDFNKILEEKGIKEKVKEELKKARRSFELEIEPSRFTIFFALKRCKVKNLSFLSFLNTLVDEYRHKSIAAHGYRGISKEEIDKKMKGDLLEKIKKEIIIPLGLPEEIIFDKINKEILIPLIQDL